MITPTSDPIHYCLNASPRIWIRDNFQRKAVHSFSPILRKNIIIEDGKINKQSSFSVERFSHGFHRDAAILSFDLGLRKKRSTEPQVRIFYHWGLAAIRESREYRTLNSRSISDISELSRNHQVVPKNTFNYAVGCKALVQAVKRYVSSVLRRVLLTGDLNRLGSQVASPFGLIRARFSMSGSLAGPVSRAPSSREGEAPYSQPNNASPKRPKSPQCRISSGICGLPLGAKIALTFILSGLATTIWSRSFWEFFDRRSNPLKLAGGVLLGWGLIALSFFAFAWTG
ncbi:hypothetical protein [Novosphingobium sp. PASSN1]|uniref:hypothetical protein n=1 Tax=Novosphingobium sp. PASSN1 TaxID=2015561 RepID=UPI0025E9051F|nr:hypothetical protein [Novosphingobium sp. PASSN1]